MRDFKGFLIFSIDITGYHAMFYAYYTVFDVLGLNKFERWHICKI